MYFDPSDRPQLKQRAKAAMRKVSPNIYLVSVVCLLHSGVFYMRYTAFSVTISSNRLSWPSTGISSDTSFSRHSNAAFP